MVLVKNYDNQVKLFERKPILRRIVYVAIYELLAIVFTLLVLEGLFDHDETQSLITAITISVTAVTWNYLWNTIFEFFEKRFNLKGRGFMLRLIHALGFEGVLIILTVPLTAFILKISLTESFFLQAGLLVFFFIYNYVFAWAFDKIFGLPASAK